MYDSKYIKGTDIPSQTNFSNEVKIKKNEEDRFTITNEFSTDDKNEGLKTAKGIIYATIFCIPFWLLFIKFALRLF